MRKEIKFLGAILGKAASNEQVAWIESYVPRREVCKLKNETGE
jgi:hypothetical protein